MPSSSRSLQIDRRALLLMPVAVGGLYLVGNSPSRTFNITNVEVAVAKTMVDAGALVIDVREADKYKFRHLVAAMLLPLATLRLGVPASLAYAKTMPILVYCSDGVAVGPEGTELLNKAGFAGAVNLKTGIEGWVAAGLPVAT
jgi:rhodanese-related sulfurtransferase